MTSSCTRNSAFSFIEFIHMTILNEITSKSSFVGDLSKLIDVMAIFAFFESANVYLCWTFARLRAIGIRNRWLQRLRGQSGEPLASSFLITLIISVAWFYWWALIDICQARWLKWLNSQTVLGYDFLISAPGRTWAVLFKSTTYCNIGSESTKLCACYLIIAKVCWRCWLGQAQRGPSLHRNFKVISFDPVEGLIEFFISLLRIK